MLEVRTHVDLGHAYLLASGNACLDSALPAADCSEAIFEGTLSVPLGSAGE